MEIGKIYIQKHSDCDYYVMPTRKLKNGGYYGLKFMHYNDRFSGKAKKGSLAHMYPMPELVENPPQQIINKFKG